MTVQAEDSARSARLRRLDWWVVGALVALIIHTAVDAAVEAGTSSAWLSASHITECVVLLLLGIVLVRQIAKHRRAQASLEAANVDLLGTQASLKTANNILRAVQNSLRQSEQRFRDAANGAPTMFWTGDAAGQATFVNKALCEFRGLTEEEARRKPWDDDIHPDDLPGCRAAFQRTLERREPWRFEYRFRRHDGVYRWLLEMGTPQYDADGTFVGVVGSCIDITDQRDAQAALRESREEAKRARQLLVDGIEGLTDSLAIYDAEDRLIICNQRYRDMFGMSPDLLSPGTRFVDILRAHVEGGRVPAAVGREDEWIAGRMSQFRDARGLFERRIDGEWYQFSDRRTSSSGTVTIFSRIDDLKQREARLRESQAMLEGVVNNIPLTVSITDRQRRIVLLNKAIEDLYGVRLADVVGRPVDEFRPRCYQSDTAITDHYRVIETGEAMLGREDQYVSAKGTESWITNIVPIKDDQGAVKYVLRTTLEVPQLAKANRELAAGRAILIEAEREAKIASWHQPLGTDKDVTWSENSIDVLGVPPEWITSDAGLLALVHSEDRERIAKLIQKVTERPAPYDVEFRVLRPDGTVAWVHGISRIQRDESGMPLRMIGTVQDITDRKRIEDALREREGRLQDAQRRAKLAYWNWRAGEGWTNTWSEGAADVLGLGSDPVPVEDEGYRALIHPDDRAAVAQAHHDNHYAGRSFTIDYRVRRSDGSFGWIRETGDAELDATGSPVRQHGTIQDITDQKQTETALRESEARLRGFLDHAPFAMYLRDTDHKYLLVNRVVEESLDLPAASILGRRPDQVHPPATAEKFITADHVVLESGMPLTYEHSDPSRQSFAEALTVRFPIRDDEGRIIAVGGITQDITERKRAEAAMRDSEARLRAFMDNAPVGMLVKDNNGAVRSINRLGASYLGRRPEDVIGRQTSEYATGGAASMVAANESAVMRKGIAVERELHFPERPELEWVHEVKFPIRDAQGDTLGLGAIIMNITDRKRAEAARQESEALLRGFMENSPVAMSIKSPEGRYLMVNRWVKLVMGRSSDEILGRIAEELSDSAGARELRDMELEVVRSGNKVEREVRFEDRATFNWTHEVKFPIRDDEGNVIAIGGVAMDIADRKRAELALRDSEARLIEAQRRAKLAYWSWSRETDTHEWSPEAASVLGRPGTMLPSRDDEYLEFVHPDDRAELRRLYAEYLERRGPYAVDYRIMRANGSTGWIRELAEPEFDARGDLERWIGTVQDVTDQKETEEALRESEALLLAAQRRAKIAYWTADMGANDRYAASEQAAEVLGVLPEDMPDNDTDYLKMIHPEDRARAASAYQRQIALQQPYSIEYRVIRSDGSIGWIRDLAELQIDANGRAIRIIGTIQDITDERRVTEALRDSEERLRAFFDNAPFAMYLKDTEHRYLMANRALERAEGRSAAAIFGKTAHDAYPPVLAERFVAEDRQVLETGRSVFSTYSDAELPFYQEVLQVKFPIRDGSGWIVAIGGVTQDVSDQRRAERALRESEARMRAFMDHIPVIMHVKDRQGRYQLVNREFERVEGLSLASVVGRTVRDVLPPEAAEIITESDRAALEEGRTVTHEYSLPSRAIYRDRSTIKFPIRSSADEIIGIGAFTQDVTERKRAERTLAESEARRREAQRRAKLAYWYWSRESDLYEWSSEAADVLGIPEAQLPRHYADYFSLVHDADREALAGADFKTSTSTAPHAIDFRILRPDGSIAWIRELAEPEVAGSGEIVRIVGTIQDITEQKRADEALRQSEAQLRRAQQQARLAYWRWELGTVKEADRFQWSPGSGQLFGVADADMPTSATAARIIAHPDDDPHLLRLYDDVRHGLDTYVVEYRVLWPDHSVVWVREIGEVVRTPDGRRVAVEGTIQDITEQRRAAEALRDSEARLRGFLDHAPFAMYLKDTNLRYLLVNREVERFQRMTATEICGRTPDQVYPRDLAARFIAEDREVMERGAPVTFEYSDPTLAAYADSLTVRFPVRDSDGQIVAIGGITQDISERKRAEAALRQSEERLRRAQRQARLAYWRWQFGNEDYSWSPGSGLIMGMPDADLPRSEADYFARIHVDDRERIRRLYADVTSELDEFRAEFRIVHPDGKTAWVRELGEVEYDGQGRRVAVAGTIQDITEQHELQEQLQQAQKIEAIGQLTGGIAHDFNNLLAIVLGNLELLQEEIPGKDGSAQRLATAVRATLRGADLTKRLLAFARRQTLAPKLTQINDLIRNMKELLRRPLGPTIDMDLRLAQDLRPAEIDPAQLETSLLNLIVNARDAMPEGGRVTVRTTNAELPADRGGAGQDAKPIDCILISVTDTGNGMTQEVMARAFDPFFTTKGVGQGTGLGLSMVYGFVKQSGGHVDLDSEPGRGTTVSLYLPCAERSMGAAARGDEAGLHGDFRLTA